METNVEKLIQAAASGEGIITDDRDIQPPNGPNATPTPATPVDAGAPASTETRELSPEEREIKALMQEMAAAQTPPAVTAPTAPAAPGAAPTAPTPAAQAIAAATASPAATPPAAEPAAPGTQPPPNAGLTAALRAEREARRKAEQENAYLRGQMDARMHATGAPATPAAPVLTPEEQVKAKREEQKALAGQFDAAKITASAWEEQRQKIEDEIAEIRSKNAQQAAPAAPAMQTDLTLEQHSQQLTKDYPVLSLLGQADIEPLVALAYAQAERAGTPIQRGTAIGTLDLRTRVAKLATQTYADVLAAATAAGQVVAPAAPVPSTQQGLSPAAAARDATLNAAANFPPNTNNMGTAANTVQPSETELDARLAGMSVAEQDQLLLSMPDMVRKLTGVALPPPRR